MYDTVVVPAARHERGLQDDGDVGGVEQPAL